MHPTKRKLLDTALDLMARLGPEAVTTDAVLEASGISRGSLYHHFTDLADLLDYANAERYAQIVDAAIGAIALVIAGAKSRAEFLEGLRTITRTTQSVELVPTRAERHRILALAGTRQELRALLEADQQRLTDSFAAQVREAQKRGWASTDVDPDAFAVFIQAFTLGKIVDDIAARHVEAAAWEALIMAIMERVFLAES